MPVMPPTHRPRGGRSKREVAREVDARRGSASARGYDHRWAKASASHLRANPLCRYCEFEGRVTAATLTDHFYPHRTFGAVLFWAKEWWVSSCDACHNGFKQRAERAGRAALDGLARRLGLPVLADREAPRGVKSLEGDAS